MKLSVLLASAVWMTSIGGVLYGADVAILDSSVNTMTFFERHYPACGSPGFYLGADEYQRYFLGWTHVLDNPQSGPKVPYVIIHDADVTDGTLSQYKLLILSNTADLSDDQQKTIRELITQRLDLAQYHQRKVK